MHLIAGGIEGQRLLPDSAIKWYGEILDQDENTRATTPGLLAAHGPPCRGRHARRRPSPGSRAARLSGQRGLPGMSLTLGAPARMTFAPTLLSICYLASGRVAGPFWRQRPARDQTSRGL